jgi:hypothetical protein
MDKGLIDLSSVGIDKAQAADLRARLATFAEDWSSPEMAVYDDYAAAKAQSASALFGMETSMVAYRVETTLSHDGTLTLDNLPLRAGEAVEVIILVPTQPDLEQNSHDGEPATRPPDRIMGLHAGTIWISDDFDEPLPDEFWLGE